MDKDIKKELNPKRAALIELSNEALEFRTLKIAQAATENEAMFWATRTINYILLNHFYNCQGATEFNTFHQWKEKGATILKGEKAFLIWGQPIRAGRRAEQPEEQQPQPGEGDNETDKYKYFPLCYLFSNKQVLLPTDAREDIQEHDGEQEKDFDSVDLNEIL